MPSAKLPAKGAGTTGGDARTTSPQAPDDGAPDDVAVDSDGGGGGEDGEDGGIPLARAADGRGTTEPFCMAAAAKVSSDRLLFLFRSRNPGQS